MVPMKLVSPGLLLVAAIATFGCGAAGSSATLQVRSAPPPPALQFGADPQFTFLSDLQVYAIADEGFGYDMFSSAGTYYLYGGGAWYRADAARGPYVAIETGRVPRSIFSVSDKQYRWRSHPAGWRTGRRVAGVVGGPGH
jgi:hypothetical protein